MDNTSIDDNTIKVYKDIACEQNNANLNCPGSSRIKILSANYGRTVTKEEVCPHATAKDDIDCVSDRFTLMSNTCNDR